MAAGAMTFVNHGTLAVELRSWKSFALAFKPSQENGKFNLNIYQSVVPNNQTSTDGS